MGSRLLTAASLSLLMASCILTQPSKRRNPGTTAPSGPESTPGENQATMKATPPSAERRAYEVPSPHGTRADPYYWLRDDTRKHQDILAYLNAENEYKNAVLAPYKSLEDKLYQEMVERIIKDDESVPVQIDDYYYFTRVSGDKEFAIHLRRHGAGGAEQVVIDENARAAGKDFYRLRGYETSPDHKKVAITEDEQGRRQYVLRIKNLETGAFLPDEIPGISASVVWANDNKSIFYIENDPTTLLGSRVKKHVLGTPNSQDVTVYEEADKSFYMGLSRSIDDKFVKIILSSTTTSELRYIPADKPNEKPRALAPRAQGVRYYADHIDGRWIIRTDLKAPNFRVMQVKDAQVGSQKNWREVVAHDPKVFIESIQLFDNYLVTSELNQGLTQLHVRSWDKRQDYQVKADDTAYVMGLGANPKPDRTVLRYTYTSPTTPRTTYELDLATKARKTLKVNAVGGEFNPNAYETKRIWVTARDKAQIPVTILHKKGLKLDGSAPMLQYGYGSYGATIKPGFRSDILSLVNRGVVYAIAHIRGGGTMGREWYESGKLLNKRNTFTDFIDVTEELIKLGYSKPERISAMGGSAGGLLMGAIANMRPDLYHSLVAQVPFVDVVTTMLDESIPLTTNEFDEWGNPKDKAFYDYMMTYSPYDNIRAQDYPAMLVTAGLWDSQVQYYEPAKWVAKLRHHKTDKNPLLFHINMDAGHGGKSGRFAALKERALTYAFVLSQSGVQP